MVNHRPSYTRDQPVILRCHEDVFTPGVRVSFEIHKRDVNHYVNPYYALALSKLNGSTYHGDEYPVYQGMLRNALEHYPDAT